MKLEKFINYEKEEIYSMLDTFPKDVNLFSAK